MPNEGMMIKMAEVSVSVLENEMEAQKVHTYIGTHMQMCK